MIYRDQVVNFFFKVYLNGLTFFFVLCVGPDFNKTIAADTYKWLWNSALESTTQKLSILLFKRDKQSWLLTLFDLQSAWISFLSLLQYFVSLFNLLCTCF